MSRDANVPHRRYTDEFKLDAMKLAESVGGTEAASPGESRIEVVELSVSTNLRLVRHRAGVCGVSSVNRDGFFHAS